MAGKWIYENEKKRAIYIIQDKCLGQLFKKNLKDKYFKNK